MRKFSALDKLASSLRTVFKGSAQGCVEQSRYYRVHVRRSCLCTVWKRRSDFDFSFDPISLLFPLWLANRSPKSRTIVGFQVNMPRVSTSPNFASTFTDPAAGDFFLCL